MDYGKILLTFSLAALILLTVMWKSANAQNSLVQGKYANSVTGVEFTLPDGQVGDVTSRADGFTMGVWPKDASGKPNTNSSNVFLIMVGPKSDAYFTSIDDLKKRQTNGQQCFVSDPIPRRVSGVNAVELLGDCADGRKKSKTVVVDMVDSWFGAFLTTDTNAFTDFVKPFDSTIQTVTIKNATDLQTSGQLTTLQFSSQAITIAGKPVSIPIQSSSNITDFALDESNKRLSFKVQGITGTPGETTLPIGRILKGPYFVSIDGNNVSHFEVVTNPTSGEDSIKLTYTHSTHEILISGSTVVPEFPIVAALLLAISLVGVVAVSRFAKGYGPGGLGMR